MLETVVQDLRVGARMLVKNPGFALVAILSIAIGVGAIIGYLVLRGCARSSTNNGADD